MKPREVLFRGKQLRRAKARSLLCYWAVKELGISTTSVANRLGMHQSSVSRAVERGQRLASEKDLFLDIEGNA